MKLKPIEWKDYNGVTKGYVGRYCLFSFEYNERSTYSTDRWKLYTKLPFPQVTFATQEECKEASQAILQQFLAGITQ